MTDKCMGASDKSDVVRGLTESGDFYSGTPDAWARYRAAVEAGDWDEVMRFETGRVEGFCYVP